MTRIVPTLVLVLVLVLALALVATPGLPPLNADGLAGEKDQRIRLEGKERTDFLALVERRMSAVRSFVAIFEQEKSLSVFKDTLESSGVLAFAQPDSMRWEIREPFRSILIVSGGKAAKFEWVGGSRRTLALGRGADVVAAVMGRIEGWFRGDFERQKDYEVDVFEKPRPVLVLRPKDEMLSKNVRSIELELAASLASIERVTIEERAGDRTVMRYALVAQDVDLPQGMFSTTDPAELDPERFRPRAPSATSSLAAPGTPSTPITPSATSAPESR